MRDRNYRIDENLLQRTAGPYIRARTLFNQGMALRASHWSLNTACKSPFTASRVEIAAASL